LMRAATHFGREAAAVVHTSFAVLAFDDAGCVDVTRFREQQYVRVETALAIVFADLDRDEKVIDAGGQFIAQGGSWTPSIALARAINDAALWRQRCSRLGARGRGA